jgi:hypothetical protein
MNYIEKVIPQENFKLKIKFDNGEEKIFDVTPYLEKGIFTELKDYEYFKKVVNNKYYISWPNEQDFSSDTLYYTTKNDTTHNETMQ